MRETGSNDKVKAYEAAREHAAVLGAMDSDFLESHEIAFLNAWPVIESMIRAGK